MKDKLVHLNNERFAFMRNDGKAIIVNGKHPEDAWENLCDSLDNDHMYIKKFLDRTINKKAISKNYEWLNKIIHKGIDSTYTNEEFGPVFIRI